MSTIQHRPNSHWTIEVRQNGMKFYVTGIQFQDIAQAAAKGIEAHTMAKTRVFLALTGQMAEPETYEQEVERFESPDATS